MEEGWERPARLELRLEDLQRLIAPAFPGETLKEFGVLATGLANTNVRFRLAGEATSYVLRLYTRDPKAAQRELELMKHLESAGAEPVIPRAALLYSSGERPAGQYSYSIWTFVEGALLQELFKVLPPAELVQIAGECGSTLAALSKHRFEKCGELGAGLEIVEEYARPSEFVPAAVHRALFEGRAGERLGSEMRDALWAVVERASPRLRAIDDRYALVHGDYKRSNLLMRRSSSLVSGAAADWSVAAVLDWEFAFAGPPLIDVGIFLRAGSALPAGFRETFADHYLEAGGALPADWLPLSRLVDVLSQVTFLDDPRERPQVFTETKRVLEETLRLLA